MVPVNISEFIHRMTQINPGMIRDKIELKTVLAEIDLNVMADPHQIEKVFRNIISNADDAMAEGGVLTISTEPVTLDMEFITARGYGNPGNYARISISDTGIGMDENIIDKIFEPFFTTKEVDKGTGLGLSIAYGIINQHDGHIEAFSESGLGTTFHIYIPIEKKEVAS